MSMCDAERRLLANALLDIGNEWFVLVSESCLPLTNFSSVYRYISGSRYSFIGAIDDLSPYGRGRSPEHDSGGKPNGMTKRVTMVRDKPKAIALNIIEDKTFYPKFEACCQPHACYVDKHYFPTMLHIQAPHLLANRSLTWVDWSRGGAHLATFGKADINAANTGLLGWKNNYVFIGLDNPTIRLVLIKVFLS